MSDKGRLGLKWLVLVWANASVSFQFALTEFPARLDRIGIAAGVFTFVLLYWRLDLELLRRNRPELRRALLWGVVLKGLTQFWPVLEILTGAAALQTLTLIGLHQIPLLTPYLATLVDGLLLSLMAGVLSLLVRLALRFWGKSGRVR